MSDHDAIDTLWQKFLGGGRRPVDDLKVVAPRGVVQVCESCGSLLADDLLDVHTAWHRNVVEFVEAAVERGQRHHLRDSHPEETR